MSLVDRICSKMEEAYKAHRYHKSFEQLPTYIAVPFTIIVEELTSLHDRVSTTQNAINATSDLIVPKLTSTLSTLELLVSKVEELDAEVAIMKKKLLLDD